jgi:RND superfamily putative drug exporter
VLARLAQFCFRRRRLVAASWIGLILVVSTLGFGVVGPKFRTDFKLPASETRQVFDFLKSRSPSDAGFNGQIVFTAPQGVSDPIVAAGMTNLFDEIGKLPGVRVTSPYSDQGKFQVSKSGTIAFARVDATNRSQAEYTKLGKTIRAIAAPKVDGLRVEYGGTIFYEFKMPASEALGVLAAIIILVLAFGSVIAMGLPVGTAVVGLMTASAVIALVSRIFPMPDFTLAMAAMIGLGVGIDYALFIVTRFREGLNKGYDAETSIVDSIDAAGRAVMFAGATVVVSLLGLFVVGLTFVRGIAIASILAVIFMVAAALTLLPALIGFSHRKIDVTTWRGALVLMLPVVTGIPAILFHQAGIFAVGAVGALVVLAASFFVPALRRQVPVHHHRENKETFWYRWSRFVQHRPWRALVGGLVPLLVLAVPLFSLRLGFGDNGNYPKKETVRRAYDLLADGFGPGFNGPLVVLVQAPNGGKLTAEQSAKVSAVLNSTPGVAYATAAQPLGTDAAVLSVFPAGSPQDRSTTQLVHHLRNDVAPATGLEVRVGGFAAAGVDFADYLGARLPWIIGGVLVVSFLLLMCVFRSLLVPLKAVIMNLLSIGAAYGIVVAIFQWGWGKAIFGLDKTGPIESWIPMFLFAIVFGLSMDYEVFLLSRMKEEFDRTGDNASAVADGLAVTARVITAAALIMVSVFASFVIGDDRQLKLFGLGMAIAVLVDATIVRMILVPATMELLGARNWWLPSWLEWLPKVHVEGSHHDLKAEGLLDGIPADIPSELV